MGEQRRDCLPHGDTPCSVAHPEHPHWHPQMGEAVHLSSDTDAVYRWANRPAERNAQQEASDG